MKEPMAKFYRVMMESEWRRVEADGAIVPSAEQWEPYAAGTVFFVFDDSIEMKQIEAIAAERTPSILVTFELTDVSRDRLSQEVAKMRAINRILKLGATQWLEGAKPLHLKLEGAEANLERAKTCMLPDGSKVSPGDQTR